MTYQESFSQAMKLKDFVRLNEDEAWIYFIFTNETDFYLKIFDTQPSEEIKHKIQRDAFYINELPMAIVSVRRGRQRILYRDLNLQLEIDLHNDTLIRFEGDESATVDMKKVRKSFKKLAGKLK
jgi:hypothetical protein